MKLCTLPQVPFTGARRAPEVRWEATVEGPVEWRPVPGEDGTVYVCHGRQDVTALEPDDGSTRWQVDLGQSLPDVPHPVPGGPVLVRSNNDDGSRSWHALDPATGEERWTLKASSLALDPWTDPAGRLYVMVQPDKQSPWKFQRLDPATGTPLWSVDSPDLPYYSLSPPLLADGTLFLSTGAQGMYRLSAIDPDTGQSRWSFQGARMRLADRLGPNGEVFVLAEKLDERERPYAVLMHALDARTGEVLWNRTLSLPEGSGTNPSVIYGAADGPWIASTGQVMATGRVLDGALGVIALEAADGHTAWSSRNAGVYDLLVAHGALYASVYCSESKEFQLQCLDPETGRERWRYGHGLASNLLPRVTVGPGDGLYVDDILGLTALDPDTGKPRWRSSPFAYSIGVATVPGGIVVGSWTEPAAAVVDTATGETRWSFGAAEPLGLGLGRDAATFSTESGRLCSVALESSSSVPRHRN